MTVWYWKVRIAAKLFWNVEQTMNWQDNIVKYFDMRCPNTYCKSPVARNRFTFDFGQQHSGFKNNYLLLLKCIRKIGWAFVRIYTILHNGAENLHNDFNKFELCPIDRRLIPKMHTYVRPNLLSAEKLLFANCSLSYTILPIGFAIP